MLRIKLYPSSTSRAHVTSLVYFKPYESNGSAWPITFARLLWALVIFQIFMTGLFSLRSKSLWAPLAMVPLIIGTVWRSYVMIRDFGGLTRYLAMSSVKEVLRGEGVGEVVGVQGESGEVSRKQR